MNYSHKMLLASSNIDQDSMFHQSLVYITAHNERHTAGFILNRESSTLLSELAKGIDLSPERAAATPKMTKPMLLGGPANSMHISIMYQGVLDSPALTKLERSDRVFTAYDGDGDKTQAIKVTKNGMSERLLREFIEKPDPDVRYQLFMGHASWEPGQLDDEVKYDHWLVLDADPDVIFSPKPATRRNLAADAIELNLNRWLPPLQQ